MIMSLQCLACSLLAIALYVYGADKVNVNQRFRYSLQVKWKQAVGHPSLTSLLGLPHDVTLEPGETYVTAHGSMRRRFRELYKGYHVIDTSVEADVDENNKYNGGPVTGLIYLSLAKDLPDLSGCTVTEEDAKSTLLNEEGYSADETVLRETVLEKVYVDENKLAHWVYTVDMLIELADKDVRPYYIIDRCSGDVLFASIKFVYMTSDPGSFTGETVPWDNSSPPTPPVSPVAGSTTTTTSTTTSTTTPAPTTTATQGSCAVFVKGEGGTTKFNFTYSTPPYCLDVIKNGDECILKNEYLSTIDLKTSSNTDKTDPIKFICSQGYPDKTNGGLNPSLDAHFYGTTAFTMFKSYLGTPPLKTAPRLMVHYRKNEANAYWTGDKMLFGDGDSETFPFVSLDIVTHELAHGYTEQTSDLIYENQSGGINEAFSDISGKTAEWHVRGTYDWNLGDDIFKSKTEALRFFDDPTKDGNSIKTAAAFSKGMDVHYSSGVYNHVFYQIVEKEGFAIRSAFEAFAIANKQYWKESTDFTSGACGVTRAAYDLGLDTVKVAKAFKVTGITVCNIRSFLEMLTTSKPRTNVAVSNIKRPVFGLVTLDNTKKITVTASSSSGTAVKVDILRALDAPPMKSGTGSAEVAAVAETLYYTRVYSDSSTAVNDVTVTLQLSD